MNLTTDAWIPIVWNSGKPGTISLQKAFELGSEIRDLALRPFERIAVMRLLICITQAALDGPGDFEEWRACRPRIALASIDYLDRSRRAFELFGDGQRFLQIPGLKKLNNGDEEGGNSISKLDVTLATGNNPTLFDNAGGAPRDFEIAQLASMLVTFQCFSPGGRIGVALWDGEPTPGEGSSEHAPCLTGGMLHTLLRGDHLLDTVHRNLLNKATANQLFGGDRWGRPVWELMPQSPHDSTVVRNATQTYLGRLVPLSRAIWLSDNAQYLILANGLEFPSFDDGWRDPSATIVIRSVRGQPTRNVLPASIEKAIWRELHVLTIKAAGQSSGGPAALHNISADEEAFDLWVGGLVASKAKLVDTVESVFHIPAAMLSKPSQRAYEEGVRYADTAESQLRRAVSTYHTKLGDHLDRAEMKRRRLQIQRNATIQFWTDIEQLVPLLLKLSEHPEGLGLTHEWGATAWGKSVWRAARAAYDRACPHETPRQICAYSLGLSELVAMSKRKARAEVEEEVEA